MSTTSSGCVIKGGVRRASAEVMTAAIDWTQQSGASERIKLPLLLLLLVVLAAGAVRGLLLVRKSTGCGRGAGRDQVRVLARTAKWQA